ncbi:MAG: DUF971 family protein [Pseudorhodobacter sp.]|jgi:DUF971 family protein
MIESLATSLDACTLSVNWDSGECTTLSAETLRREAQDAWSKRERMDHGAVAVAPGITITALVQVGQAGVNIHFSDGHQRAIYPFVYLRTLSDRFDK